MRIWKVNHTDLWEMYRVEEYRWFTLFSLDDDDDAGEHTQHGNHKLQSSAQIISHTAHRHENNLRIKCILRVGGIIYLYLVWIWEFHSLQSNPQHKFEIQPFPKHHVITVLWDDCHNVFSKIQNGLYVYNKKKNKRMIFFKIYKVY